MLSNSSLFVLFYFSSSFWHLRHLQCFRVFKFDSVPKNIILSMHQFSALAPPPPRASDDQRVALNSTDADKKPAVDSSSSLHQLPIVTDSNHHVTQLLQLHEQSPKFIRRRSATTSSNSISQHVHPIIDDDHDDAGDGVDDINNQMPTLMSRKPHGGVLPATQDPITGEVFILLGVDKRGYFNDFHGEIDDGETVAQGAAREGWEESKATFGDLPTLWRAVTLKGVFSVIVGNPRKNIHLINLGEMNFVERSALCAKFQQQPSWSRCSNEVKSISFFELKSLRAVCMNALQRNEKIEQDETGTIVQNNQRGSNDGDAPPTRSVRVGSHHHRNPVAVANKTDQRNDNLPLSNPKADLRVVVHVNEHTGIQECLRACLAEGMCDRRFWSQDIFVNLLMMGRPLRDYVLPLPLLPKLQKQEIDRLPFSCKLSSSPVGSHSSTTTAGRFAAQSNLQQQPLRASSSAIGSRGEIGSNSNQPSTFRYSGRRY